MWFFRGWRLILLRRCKATEASGGDQIVLTCIGLSTRPLRLFLHECQIGTPDPKKYENPGHEIRGPTCQNGIPKKDERLISNELGEKKRN